MVDVLTHTVNQYIGAFSGYVGQFLAWGKAIFFTLLTINIVWITLWYAFDKNSLTESLGDFIKQFFVIALFYTILINHSWLVELMKATSSMGKTLTGIPIDPSSIVSNGISIANKILVPLQEASILTGGFGLLVGFVAWLVITFTFVSIAINLSLVLIITTALITMATFFLGFAALGATNKIARQALDVVLANCVKLLGIYLTVGVGAKTISSIAASIPTKVLSFDAYTWIIAASLLFWLISKNLPEQLAQIVSNCIQESRGTDAAALAMSAVRYARMSMPAAQVAAGGAMGMAKIAGSVGHNAMGHAWANKSMGAEIGTSQAIKGTVKDIASSAFGTLSDQFKHLGSKLVGGQGLAAKAKDIPGFAQRMHKETQALYAQSAGAAGAKQSLTTGGGAMGSASSPGSAGAPSSAGRKAAGASATRSSLNKSSAKKAKK